jgi:hypothetical protein
MITIETLRDQIDAMERMQLGKSMRCKAMKRQLAVMLSSDKPKRDKNGRFCK